MNDLEVKEIEVRLKEASEKAKEFIRAYPLTSVALGVAVGVLLTKLLTKKR